MERKDQTMTLIKYPYSRLEVYGSLEHLANFEEQKEWINKDTGGNYPHPYWDWLRYYVIDIMYGEYYWDKYIHEEVLETFYNDLEAEGVCKFCTWFDGLIDEIGDEKPDSAYLEHPEWPNVIKGAKEIFELMQQNNEKYDYAGCLDIFNYEPFEEWEKRFEK